MDEASAAALVGMIDHVYAAALDAERWGDFLNSVSGHFRNASTIIWHTDQNDDRCNIFASHRYQESTLRSLQEHYYAVNPWVPKKMRMPSGAIHRTEALYPERELIKTEFYSDFLVPNDLFKGFGISLFNGRRFGFLSVVRSRHAGAASADEIELLERLTPHLQRAIQVHERLRLPPELAAPALTVVEELSHGVVFVGRDKRIVYVNAVASRMLSEADGLSLDPTGSCRTNRAAEQANLDKLLDGAISGRWRPENEGRTSSSGGLMVITRRSGRGPYGVVVSPMPSPPFGLAAAHVAAVLLISDPDVDARPLRDVLRRLYRLSEKEAVLAVRIADGQRLDAAAKETGISYETARSYLKAVFGKLGVHRQAELASAIRKLPALR